jgi:phospholipid/cholesterol/gamma-HCH transport system substrate-binding protein
LVVVLISRGLPGSCPDRLSGQWLRDIGAALALLCLAITPLPALAQGETLRVILPAEGTDGLEAGADVLVLGLKAGTVRRIGFAPGRRLVAEVEIDQAEARDFIRRDSVVTLRHRRGGLGAAYLFIGRGEGEPLDWSAASLAAQAETNENAAMVALLTQLRDRALPVLDDVGRVARVVASEAERIERGDGALGRLLADDRLADMLQTVTGEVATLVQGGLQLIGRLDRVTAQAERLLSESSGGNGSLAALLRRVDQTLANLERATRDVTRASGRLPQTLRNVEDGTATLPGVLLQTQQTTRELELLLGQLRGLWLLGGSGPPPPEPSRPSVDRLRP